jgi:hypothetical protein
MSWTAEGVVEVRASGDSFFMYDPSNLPDDRRFPFATIVTGDRYDQVSELDRPSVYRLNIGLSKSEYVARFGAPPTRHNGAGSLEQSFDYTAMDQVMPHPVYGAAVLGVCAEPRRAHARPGAGTAHCRPRFRGA